MAKLELSEEVKAGKEGIGTADLLIAITAPVDLALLQAAVSQGVDGPGAESLSVLRTVVAYPGLTGSTGLTGGPGETESLSSDPSLEGQDLRVQCVPYMVPASTPSAISWLTAPPSYQAILAMARELGVSACAVIGYDLAALETSFLVPMLAPILEQRCDLAMPLYASGKFDGLLNSSILAPLSQALYGRRIRFPLAPDFCISAKAIPAMEAAVQRSVLQGQTLFWPATEAALRDLGMCQVHVDTRHVLAAEGVDLTTVLSHTVGPLFAEMMTNASLWQRVRGAQAVPVSGVTAIPPIDVATADTKPMLETFQLGFRNLQEVWSLVLPPVTLLDLKRLARPGHERFQMPDELWVRIVYDFALAYRLRTLSRTHLLGALTPLYLGWVASYALEVGNASPAEAEHRLEKLARAYEEGKPYLLSRWRWPDRFNP